MNAQLPPPGPPASPNGPVGSTRSRARLVLATGVGAGLLVGGVIGAAAGAPLSTSAAPPVAVGEPADEPVDEPVDDTSTASISERLRAVLQPLVDDGAIDAEQADLVAEHLAAERAERGPRRGAPHHRAGPWRHAIRTTAEVLGIDAETLRDELRSGSSPAEIAEADGVDPQTLIDALLAEVDEHAAELENRIVEWVDGG